LLIGNGYAGGHADFALDVLRGSPGARALIEARLANRPPATCGR
jgi:L-erythro-3,5-diaminohexanoate dehydrogenase